MPPIPPLTGQDVGEAQGALSALLERALDGTGSSGDEYVVMRVLALRGPWSPPALHEFLTGQRQLGLGAAGVAALLSGLETTGLATGTALDHPGPARLTDQGAARHAELAELVTPVTAKLFADFAPDELATTRRVLHELTERARHLHATH